MKILMTTVLGSILFACSSASVALDNKQQVRKSICKEWKTVYNEMAGVRAKIPEEQQGIITFNENGTFTSHVKNGVVETKGEWNYDPKTKFLYMGKANQTKGSATILKLDGKEMILAEHTLMNDKIVDSIVVTYQIN